MKLPSNILLIVLQNMIRALENTVAKILHVPERLVDGVGMYRVVTQSLVVLVVCSFAASATGLLVYSLLALVTSLATALLVGLGSNVLLATLWRVPANHESALITALILFFLTTPTHIVSNNWLLAAAVALAMVSKYVLVYRRQHIANPAAIGAVLMATIVGGTNMLTDSSYNTDLFGWWVGNPVLFWPTLVLGTLIVFKVRKWTPVLWFIGVGLVVFLVESIWYEQPLLSSTVVYFFSFPTLFLAFFMLTEPFTMPPTKRTQALYGATVGALSSTSVFAAFVPMTPELALVLGGLVVYLFRIRQKLFLPLQDKRQIATDTWEFVFTKPSGFSFQPGQYLEWMLPHEGADSRGLRRYFTIASSPTESVVRLALKVMPENGSTYKASLQTLDQDDVVIASQLAGNFLLPATAGEKLGFIAGGIGVTPFSSHLRYMADSDNAYDTHLYYCCNTLGELGYLEDFRAMDLPLEVIPVIAKEEVAEPNERGFVTIDMLDRRTPDWRERTWYLSGPPGMVNAYYKLLRDAGLPKAQIKKDFFPGLA